MCDESYDTVAIICKEIFNFTDTYAIDVKDPENVLDALMFVLAIDAESVPATSDKIISTQIIVIKDVGFV